tara:strand:+ start:61 stop:525 length:465 start_codon:yes stop_codon:yes gene_type:complete
MLFKFGNNQTLVSQIDEIFSSLKKQRGGVSSAKPRLKLESRDCFVYTVHDTHIHNQINALLGCEQSSIHVMEYGVDQHFQSWHQDNSGKANDRRKVSMSLLLNNNFQGGQLEFETQSANLTNVGDYVIFDSMIRHRVTKVTQGTRKTLVCWGYG